MSTHKIRFHGEMRKIFFLLPTLIWSFDYFCYVFLFYLMCFTQMTCHGGVGDNSESFFYEISYIL